MAFQLQYPDILFSLICFVSLYVYHIIRARTSSTPTNWPLLGMTPSSLWNFHRFNDYIGDILKENGGTFRYKGIWFAGQDMLITSDPSNFRYITTTNFQNYPKGQEFKETIDILGDGIFGSDYELWELHRKTTLSFFKGADFLKMVEKITWNNVEKKLMPVLEHMSELGSKIDFQSIFQRLTFDSILKLTVNYDSETLSVGLLPNEFEAAFTKSEEAVITRNLLPKWYWMLLNRLQIGNEKHYIDAAKLADEIFYKLIKETREKQTEAIEAEKEQSDDSMLIKGFMRKYRDQTGSFGNPDKFLRDTLLSLVAAGRDTTSSTLTWFFYLLTKNPAVQYKIYKEIQAQLGMKEGDKWKRLGAEELNKLGYLHGALYEALRLFPPVPLNLRVSKEADTLPSGHRVNAGTRVILHSYAMGRTGMIWGQDCMEFKPERWLSLQDSKIKYVPSYKFPAFHAGPRTCLGKHISLLQMKVVAASIIYNYKVEGMQGMLATQNVALILQLKYGLMVKLTKRKWSM